jgi:dipeptidyl aminopeptidase/acylaminoacyl peptidase
MPVVGDPRTANDSFVRQVVGNAEAAVAAAVASGIADPERVAVVGHSYGAFMAVTLLAHSDLFRAGVAMSGAYNRTLTPFGFQTERRNLWEAPATYLSMSPFLSADRIDEPVLLIHGEYDEHPGTPVTQSTSLYDAIRANGGTARLVVLPFEGHVYRARESALHALAEIVAWLDRYVKPARLDPAVAPVRPAAFVAQGPRE